MNHIKSHKKKIIPLVVFLTIILIAYFYQMQSGKSYQGVIEATIYSATSEVCGKVIDIPIEIGMHVSQGDTLAILDSSSLQYDYDQLSILLEKQRVALADLKVGTGDSQAEYNISSASASYASAITANEKANQDYQNAKSLYAQGAVSEDVLEQARVTASAASGAVTAAKAQLNIARSSSSYAAMELDIAQTESQLDEIQDILNKYTITAVCDGTITSKSYLSGDFIGSGYQIADIAGDSNKYFVFYLPIQRIDEVEYNQKYQIQHGNTSYEGVVKYIDVKGEYTPKDLQTAANKNQESIKIKLLLPNDCYLKPGQEATLLFESSKLD